MKLNRILSLVFMLLGVAAFITGVVFLSTIFGNIGELISGARTFDFGWKLIAGPILSLFGLFMALVSAHYLLES